MPYVPNLFTGSLEFRYDDTTVRDRITTLEDKYVYTTRFVSIGAGASGTLTLPANSTIVLDDFGGTVDAIVSGISTRPTFESVVTSSGAVVATTLDGGGNWAFSGTPSAYPVALVYRVKQKLKDYDSAATDIIEGPEIEPSVPKPLRAFIEVPLAKTYVLDQYAQTTYTIFDVVAKMSAGTATGTIAINGVAVTGLDSVSLDNTEKTFTATAGNTVAIGDTVTLVIASPVGTQDLALSVRCL